MRCRRPRVEEDDQHMHHLRMIQRHATTFTLCLALVAAGCGSQQGSVTLSKEDAIAAKASQKELHQQTKASKKGGQKKANTVK
jgi:hypothetical protein